MSKVVLVTGCSRGGIGYALQVQVQYLCERFAAEGCRTYATARRLESIGAGLADNPLISVHILDITNDSDVRRVLELVIEESGRIDIVVNNAGLVANLETVKSVFEANTFGAFRVAQAAFPHMAARKSGLIVNIGSVVGDVPIPWNGLYSATKAAMHSMSNILSMELRPFNIRVLNVAPGAIRSNLAANGGAGFSLDPTSLYTAYLPDIIRRLNSSQGSAAMPADAFARKVVKAALKRHPPTHMTIGGNAWLFKIMRWLPTWFVLWFWWRMFSKKR
ncbi:oxidoreductase [Mycena amicta]|nr:oxidoreductase [Mycena amicta]